MYNELLVSCFHHSLQEVISTSIEQESAQYPTLIELSFPGEYSINVAFSLSEQLGCLLNVGVQESLKYEIKLSFDKPIDVDTLALTERVAQVIEKTADILLAVHWIKQRLGEYFLYKDTNLIYMA